MTNVYESEKDSSVLRILFNNPRRIFRSLKRKSRSSFIERITFDFPEELIRKLICAFDYDHSFEFWVANVFGFAYLNSDTIIQVYSSVLVAERENNIQRHIGSVCKGKRKTAGGFKWKYI